MNKDTMATIRRACRLNRRQFGRALGISGRRIEQLERGRGRPSTRELGRVLVVFGQHPHLHALPSGRA